MKERGIHMIEHNQVQEAVSSCLVEPFYRCFESWINELKSTVPNKQADIITREIENIRRQMSFQGNKTAVSLCSSTGLGYENIIPTNVKDYLYRYFFKISTLLCM